MADFTGQHVLVVGATGAIGESIARKLTERGAVVTLAFGGAEALAAELGRSAAGPPVRIDVADAEATGRAVGTIVDRAGRLDAVINTAGHMHGLDRFVDMDLSNIQQTLAVELLGVMHLAKATVPVMTEIGYGCFVTVGSDSGKVGAKGVADSAAARGGVIAFSKSLAREVAEHEICVNVVCPGQTASRLFDLLSAGEALSGKQMRAVTRAIPKKRVAEPEEVEAVAVFLASRDASFMTGQAISAAAA